MRGSNLVADGRSPEVLRRAMMQVSKRLNSIESALELLSKKTSGKPGSLPGSAWTFPTASRSTATWDGSDWVLDSGDAYLSGAENYLVVVNGVVYLGSRITESNAPAGKFRVVDWNGDAIPTSSEVEMVYEVPAT